MNPLPPRPVRPHPRPRVSPKTPGQVHLAWYDTAVGPVVAGATDRGICLLDFRKRGQKPVAPAGLSRWSMVVAPHPHLKSLEKILASLSKSGKVGKRIPLDLVGTPFQHQVWRALQTIPRGKTWSYTDLARAIGRPSAVRAVAQANGRNPVPILVPCHRVIAKDGGIGGYSGGIAMKKALLSLEGVQRWTTR